MILRWFLREWRSFSVFIVWLSLALVVACVFALTSVSSRIEQSLNVESREFLAGDRVLRAVQPIPTEWLTQARTQGLAYSEQMTFMSMSFADNKMQLTFVKAADANYPLYGELKTQPAGLKPQSGEVLVAERLLQLLGLDIGAQLELGDSTFTIIGQLIEEPDSGFNPFNTSPRVLISLADAVKTGAIQPGSRVTYRTMFAGSETALSRYDRYLTPQLLPTHRWQQVGDDSSAVGKSLQRAQNFLLLAGVLTLVLASAALAIAMQHYCTTRYSRVAVLKTLGVSRFRLRGLLLGQWAILLLLGALSGLMVGFLAEWMLLNALKEVLPADLPSAGITPLLWSLGVLILISTLVGARAYKQLLATPPSHVLREQQVRLVWPLRYYLPVVLLIIAGVLVAFTGFNALLLTILLGLFILVILLGVVGLSGLWVLKRLTIRSLALRLAINRLLRSIPATMVQIGTFSLSFMLLALLFNLQGGLLERWQQQLPADSPNYFLLNIKEQEITGVTTLLTQHNVEPSLFYPVVRVRLAQINQQNVQSIIAEDSPGYEAINRELNLTWLSELPPGNTLRQGQWPPTLGETSIEEGVAERLGVHLGDELTFMGSGAAFSAKVTSVRKVNWESMQPNFYFIFPPQGLAGQPQAWLTSFRSSPDNPLLLALTKEYPSVTLLDIDSIVTQIHRILSQVSLALEVMVAMVIICGVLLMFAQLQVGLAQRRKELTVFRVLGAKAGLLKRSLFYEFATIGMMVGVTAVIGFELITWQLQRRVFDFPWQPNLLLWGVVPLLSTLLLALCALFLGQRLFQRKNQEAWREMPE